MKQAEAIPLSEAAYNWALQNGIAKEQARAVLPEGNTQSTLYMAGRSTFVDPLLRTAAGSWNSKNICVYRPMLGNHSRALP